MDSIEVEDSRPIENQEQQPLREKNGISNIDGGSSSSSVVSSRNNRNPSIVPTTVSTSPLAARTRRLPPRFDLNVDTHDWRGEPSPTGSPASSPSSPFRKKLVFTMPGIMRPKEPREYKLRVFVTCTFFVLILMMSLTYVYHQQRLLQMMQLSLGERIQFAENNRLLYITNAAKQNMLTANLGTLMSTKELPRNCPINVSINETACLDWNHWARLNIIRLPRSGSAKCYQILWQSNKDDLTLNDCFSLSNAFWYGVGEYTPQLWPMNFLETNNTAFVSGNLSVNVFGHVLERYWMSSKGVALIANPSFRLDVTFDYDVRGQVCLTSTHRRDKRAVLNYTLCAADDARDVHRHIVEMFRPRPVRPSNLGLAVENIVWSTRQRFGDAINSSSLKDFTELLRPFEHEDNPRALVLDSSWQTVDGDFTFDPVRFADMKEVASILRNRGYKLVLNVHPYVSTVSENYYEYLVNDYWVRDITGQVPSLVHWSKLMSAVVIDFTNTYAVSWFQHELKRLQTDYKVIGFQFDGGESTSLPAYSTFNSPLSTHDDYTALYNEIAINSSLAFSVNAISRLQSLPAFTELSSRLSVWGLPRGLRSVIPAVLSTSLAGHPFTLIGPVGGFNTAGTNPERELYVRWLQVAIFFPVLQLSVLPSDYDDEVSSIAIKCIQFRRAVVLPLLKEAIDECIDRGTPIIRPLWWLAPNDTNAHDIDSEFLVGNDLLVAPILEPHADERDIYLPPGLWTDREGAVHKGGKWIYDHRSSLSKVAYFTRMPESHVKPPIQSSHRIQ